LVTTSGARAEPAREASGPAGGDRRFLLVALGVAALLRLEGLLWPLKPDESGFLLVSRNWHPQPGSLYGPLFVDRPPVLIALYRLCDLIGGRYAPRIAAAVLVFVLVYAAYRVGLLLGGPTTARMATVAAVALTGQPDLEMWAAKSESLGVPFVMLSCWLSLEALYRESHRGRYAFGAGVAGALAIGMKQNLIGGGVFGLVLLSTALVTRRIGRAEARRVGAAAVLGFAVPIVGVCGWAAASGAGVGTLWDTLYGFRGKAFAVITAGHMDAPLSRLNDLAILFVTTGIAAVLVWFAARFRSAWRAQPEATVAVAGR
jgi:hypothetical protein